MKRNQPRPDRLDVRAFARSAGRLEGVRPLDAFRRLAAVSVAAPGQTEAAPVHWTLEGQARPAPGGEPQTWLHAHLGAKVRLECQRCLEPVEQDLDVSASFQFVNSEDEAAVLDAQTDHDVLAADGPVDAFALMEDELLLALPIVAMHEVCPGGSALARTPDGVAAGNPPERKAAAEASSERTWRPFAGLAGAVGLGERNPAGDDAAAGKPDADPEQAG